MKISKHSLLEINMGCNYSSDDLEFLQAIDRYKRSNQRPHPTWSEVLNILLSLGYRKVADKSVLPKPEKPFVLIKRDRDESFGET